MPELAASVILFYFLHSFLAARRVRRWCTAHVLPQRWYRLFYTLLSLCLAMLVVQRLTDLPLRPIYSPAAGARVAGWSLVFGGALLSIAAVRRFGALGFIGLRPEERTGLVRSGLHGHMRHPIYTGIIIAATGWLLLSPSLPVLLVVALTFLYLPVGIRLEEQKLIADHGEEYIRYRKEVPALFPKVKLLAGTFL